MYVVNGASSVTGCVLTVDELVVPISGVRAAPAARPEAVQSKA